MPVANSNMSTAEGALHPRRGAKPPRAEGEESGCGHPRTWGPRVDERGPTAIWALPRIAKSGSNCCSLCFILSAKHFVCPCMEVYRRESLRGDVRSPPLHTGCYTGIHGYDRCTRGLFPSKRGAPFLDFQAYDPQGRRAS